MSIAVAGCGRIAFESGDDASPPTVDSPDSEVRLAAVLTADNGYRIAWGSGGTLDGIMPGHGSTLARDIFSCPLGNGPQREDIMIGSDRYVYVATWADQATSNGLIGNLTGTTRRPTGAAWEVCAVGIEYPASSTGPSASEIEVGIASCDAGSSASRGWVSTTGAITPGAVGQLAVGEANNSDSGTFQIACQPTTDEDGIDPDARWVWYDPMDGMSAFGSNTNNRTKAYHLYRIAARE